MLADADLEILGRKLVLVSRDADFQHMPIDQFFRSLAADQHDRAGGVVLSGPVRMGRKASSASDYHYKGNTDGVFGELATHGLGSQARSCHRVVSCCAQGVHYSGGTINR